VRLQPTQSELVLQVLLTLPEEILEFNAVQLEARKRDILEALTLALPSVFGLFGELLPTEMQAFVPVAQVPPLQRDPATAERFETGMPATWIPELL